MNTTPELSKKHKRETEAGFTDSRESFTSPTFNESTASSFESVVQSVESAESHVPAHIYRIGSSQDLKEIPALMEYLRSGDVRIAEGVIWALSRFDNLPDDLALEALEISRAIRSNSTELLPDLVRSSLVIEAKTRGTIENLDQLLKLEPFRTVTPALIVLAQRGDIPVREFLKRHGRDPDVFPYLRDTAALTLDDQKLEQHICQARERLRANTPSGYIKEKHVSYLCETRDPVFCSPYLELVTQTLNAVSSVTATMEKEFGEQFVGVIIHGSLARGVFKPGSDIDYNLIYEGAEIEGSFFNQCNLKPRFNELCRQYGLKPDAGESVDPSDLNKINRAQLFKFGLFSGNQRRLRQLQAEACEKLNEPEWKEVQDNHMIYIDSYRDKLEHFGFGPNDIDTIRSIRRLRFGLLDLSQALNFLS